MLFLIEMAILSRLVAKFNSYYAEKPGMICVSGAAGYLLTVASVVLTMMITNAVCVAIRLEMTCVQVEAHH